MRFSFLSVILLSLLTGYDALKRSPLNYSRQRSIREKINSELVPKKYPSLQMTPALKLASMFCLGLASATIFWNSGRQFETVDSIPSQYFKEKQTIQGEVIKVTDGDTFRLRHIPGFWSSAAYTGNLKDHTLAVRIYAVDTPETAKFGNPGQPYGEEATKYVEKKMLNKKVSLKLLSKDRYGRALAAVTYQEDGFLFLKGKNVDISEDLVRKGLAVVYRQGGAQYDGGIARWDKLEETAKRQKVGIWSQDSSSMQSPAEYKKAMAADKVDKKEKILKPSKRGIRRYEEVSGNAL